MPDGSFSETAENEKNADFKITHMKYFLRDNQEKKMSLMIVLCKNSQLGQDIFGTHLLTQFYHEFAPEESKDNRIRCVDSFEELVPEEGSPPLLHLHVRMPPSKADRMCLSTRVSAHHRDSLQALKRL